MKILVIGSGGREHALTWALAKDPETSRIYAAPGNPGIAEIATIVPIKTTAIEELATFALQEHMDLTVVGPETPLGAGIVDTFRKKNLRIFGPEQRAARIETSKSFAKDLCNRYDIPTPRWETFTDENSAKRELDYLGPPWVVKADGLAAGKGTTVTKDRREAETAIHGELQRDAGRIVVEEFIDGWEASFTATISNGRVQWLAPIFQDYKPIFDDDSGPNTGGMGVYSPVPAVTHKLVEKVRSSIIKPTVEAMVKENSPFQGTLYTNIIVKHGTEDPYVLEFNARFGDPETQGIVPLIKGGLADHLSDVADNSSRAHPPECSSSASLVVVLASKGYPTNPSTGDKIVIGHLPADNVVLFQAGTSRDSKGQLITAGGRVLNIAATAPNVESARRTAYSTIENAISFPGMHYRRDIGSGQPRHRRLEPAQM